jgi:hypothetical protein
MPHPSANGKRGRPPGTGKNDTDRLTRIALLLAADPDLKPTTAIKRIGETDPSTIRRLRDKYNEQQAQLITATSATLSAPHTTRHTTAQLIHYPSVAAPVETVTVPTAVRDVIAHETAAPAARPPLPDTAEIDFEPLFKPAPVQDPFMIFGKWFGNGIETAAVLFEQQMMFAQTMLKATPVKAMWRQHIVATEYLLMLSGPGQRIASPTRTGAS